MNKYANHGAQKTSSDFFLFTVLALVQNARIAINLIKIATGPPQICIPPIICDCNRNMQQWSLTHTQLISALRQFRDKFRLVDGFISDIYQYLCGVYDQVKESDICGNFIILYLIILVVILILVPVGNLDNVSIPLCVEQITGSTLYIIWNLNKNMFLNNIHNVCKSGVISTVISSSLIWPDIGTNINEIHKNENYVNANFQKTKNNYFGIILWL